MYIKVHETEIKELQSLKNSEYILLKKKNNLFKICLLSPYKSTFLTTFCPPLYISTNSGTEFIKCKKVLPDVAKFRH